MCFRYALCLLALASQPAFAGSCDFSIGDYKFAAGDVESTSVVGGNNAQVVLSKDASKKLEAMAAASTEPVLVKVGTFQTQQPLKTLLGTDSAAPELLKNVTITIPGQSLSDGLVLQQQLRLCID